LANCKASAGIGFDDADAFNSTHLCHIAPDAFAEIDLGMVQSERLDLNNHMARQRLRVGKLPDNQLFGAAVLLDNDCAHRVSS